MKCDYALQDNSFLSVRYPPNPRYSTDEIEVILSVNKEKYCIFKDSFCYVFQQESTSLLTNLQIDPSIIIDSDEIRFLLDEMSDNLYKFILFENRNLTTTLVNTNRHNQLRLDLWRRDKETWMYTLLYSFVVDRTNFSAWLTSIGDIMRTRDKCNATDR